MPEGGSTGAGNSSTTPTSTPAPLVRLCIRNSCTGGNSLLPSTISGSGPSGAAEALAKELLIVHPDPQRLTRAIMTASSSYSNNNKVQVTFSSFASFKNLKYEIHTSIHILRCGRLVIYIIYIYVWYK